MSYTPLSYITSSLSNHPASKVTRREFFSAKISRIDMYYLLVLFLLSSTWPISESRLRSAAVPLGSHPGVIIRLRKSAIDSVINRSTGLFAKYATKIPIPDFTANIGGVDFETKNARLSQFDQPEIHYELSSPNVITGELTLPTFGAQADFNATRRVIAGGSQQDSAQITFNATDVKAGFVAKIGQFENGVPNVASFQCNASLGPANLKVYGAKEQFAVDVLSVAAKTIRPLFDAQLCTIAKKMITGQLNNLLGKIPNTLEINPKVAIKYQLKPVVGRDYVQVELFEKVLTDTASPFTPAPFVEAPNENATVVLFLSDAIVNDLLYQAHVNKMFQLSIDPSSPSILYNMIRLQCRPGKKVCLGNVVPRLAEKYGPDAAVRVTAQSIRAPRVEFTEDRATFSGAVQSTLHVTPSNDSQPIHQCTATVDLAGSVQVKIHDDRIYGKVIVEQVNVNVDKDKARQYGDALEETIKRIVEQHINGDLLLKGLPLKLPFGIGMAQPTVTFAPNTLQAHTGFQFNTETSSEDQMTQTDEEED